MQCASCQFQNMPGLKVCGRCGSPLGLKTLAVGVSPPRAGTWIKRFRRWLPFRPVFYGARDAGQRITREGWFQGAFRVQVAGGRPGVLARLIVPGWPQFYLGQRALGWMLLGGYLACLALAILLFGTTFGGMVLGLAFSVHLASCLSVLRFGGAQSWAFLASAVLLAVILFVGLYLPAGWLVSWVSTPALIQADMPPFANGDVILTCPAVYVFRTPRPGDVVLYNQAAANYPLAGNQHGYIRVQGGQRIDRILAGPGDRVVWKDHKLTVNGEPSAWQPLNPEAVLPDLTITVPPGCYLILPTAGPPIPENLSRSAWHNLAVVPAEAIRGLVYLRSFPYTRIQRIS